METKSTQVNHIIPFLSVPCKVLLRRFDQYFLSYVFFSLLMEAGNKKKIKKTFLSQAPYIMYVEVLETDGHEPLPPRLLPPAPPAPHSPPIRHTKSEENLVPEWPALSLYSGLDDADTGDCWSHDDEELSTQYSHRAPAPDSLSQVRCILFYGLTETDFILLSVYYI